MNASAGELRLRRDILNYFLRNPEAADDLEGIVRWRLLQESLARTVDEAGRAVEWLVSKGFLTRIPTSSGAIFRLKDGNRASAGRFAKGLHD